MTDFSVKCNLIIDSCCDLPAHMVKKEGVYLIKFPYTASDGEHLDDLYQSTTPKEFFDRMRKGDLPQTAQLSMPALREAYTWAKDQGLPCVFLSFSSGLSGSFDVANVVLDQMKADDPDLDITLVDTRQASLPEGLLVYEAMRQRNRGMTAEELAVWAMEARNYVRTQFMVDDLDSLHRGGRIPGSVAMVGTKLDVKPLLSIDDRGELNLVGVSRGRKKGIKSMLSFFEKTREDRPGNVVIIGTSDCDKEGQRLADGVRAIDPSAVIIHSSIGPVIGSHVGPNMVALTFWGEDIREDLSMVDRIASKVKGK